MSGHFITVERAAERLGLHPKTVLRMIHDGRLKATRIGKAYRIARPDLEALTGEPAVAPAMAHATTVVEATGLDRKAADRIATTISAALTGREARARPIHLSTAFDPEAESLKVVILAEPTDAARLLQVFAAVLEQVR